MKKETILVFAPHPDDEVLGCGGYIAKQRAEGAQVYVVVVSDGALGLPKGTSPEIRQQECIVGLAHLDINQVQFWNYPDNRVPLSGAILNDYQRVVEAIKPTRMLLPHPQESHLDHIRVTRGLLKALEGRWQGELLFYETVNPVTLVNHIVNITAEFGYKLLAIQAHTSQLNQFDYVTHIQTLARWRGLHDKMAGAEAFLQHEWDGSYQHFFENRPLISVIVRADDMSYLRHALNSLIRQSYDQLEIILVWFGAEVPALEEFEFLEIYYLSGKASRSFNLNLGLKQVRGEYVAILDQDDIVYQQHFASLLTEIHGYPQVDVVYSGCKVVACEKIDNQVKVTKVLEIMNHAWQPGRLLIGNRIPIHALLFRTALFHAHQFDETLEAYEDWELLARLTLSNFSFSHLDEITCEYRAFSEKGETLLSQLHEEKGYTQQQNQVLTKLLQKIELKHFKQIVDLVENLETQQITLEKQLAEQTQQNQTLVQQLAQFHSLEQLFVQACQAVGVEAAGRQGIAQVIGRALSQTTNSRALSLSKGTPMFAIILPVYNTDASILSQTLLSIRNQAYPGWELCLVDDASTREETQQLLQTLPTDTVIAERLHYQRRDTQGGIVVASNDAIQMATAPYLVFLDHDDRLDSEALLNLAIILEQEGDYTLMYTDSRVIDHGGRVMHTYHKSDWAPETLLSINYINHLTVIKRNVLLELGHLNNNFSGVQDWHLLLQLVAQKVSDEQVCHIDKPLYDWRATENSLAYQGNAKPWISDVAQSALLNHLQTLGLQEVSVTSHPQGLGFICQWRSSLEPIDIIIPTQTNINGLKNCLNGLLHQTDYPHLNITIVANRCSAEMRDYLNTVQSQSHVSTSSTSTNRVPIGVLFNDNAFNWATLNNQAVRAGNSPLLLFLNDEIEIKNTYWLRDLRRYLDLNGVGAVGATLFSPNGSLLHNGIRTDPQEVAINIIEWGEMGELRVTHNVSAVTGACLLTKRSVWEQVDGFDEAFAISYNDVDFCLTIRTQSLRIVQATDVELIQSENTIYGTVDHAEKQTLLHKEKNLMREKWGGNLKERYLPRYEVLLRQSRILHVD